LEFSFDRSNNTQFRNSTPEQPAAGATRAPDDGIDPSTISNERLRKAIERNRARQAERMKNQPQPAASQEPVQAQVHSSDAQPQPAKETETNNSQQASLFDRPSGVGARVRVRAQERVHADSVTPVTSSAIVTRKGVARPDEADFTPVKRAPKKVSSHISYSTSSARKKLSN